MNARLAVGLIALAELLGTSLWFTANGVAPGFTVAWGLDAAAVGHLTSAVQAGFIAGTLLFALSGLADRFSPARTFFCASLLGAAANLGFALAGGFHAALLWRALTGLALAGIYPIGMKLVVRRAPADAGRALGWLVGMLVLGTSLPHLFQGAMLQADWRLLVALSSLLAAVGGVIVLGVGDGGDAAVPVRAFNWGGVLRAFRLPAFRAAAGGYFGHMWELYALWTVAPFLLRAALPEASSATISLASFAFIALGAAGCIGGGYASRRWGSARVAAAALAASGLLCIAYPMLAPVHAGAPLPVLALLAAWGVAVVADSPQFSALVARHAPTDATGSALAIVNGIGFFITIVSISWLMALWQDAGASALWLLAAGPLLGLLQLRPLLRRAPAG